MKKVFLTASVASIISLTAYVFATLPNKEEQIRKVTRDSDCKCVWLAPSSCKPIVGSDLRCQRACAKRIHKSATKAACGGD